MNSVFIKLLVNSTLFFVLVFSIYAANNQKTKVEEIYVWGSAGSEIYTLNLSAENNFTLRFGSSIIRDKTYKGVYLEFNNRIVLKFTEDTSPVWHFPIDYNVVEWGERKYLISDLSMQDFCNYINTGAEPREEVLGNYGIFIRVGDEKKAVTGKPELNEYWKKIILDDLVSGRIVKKIDDKYGLVDIGRNGKISSGLTLSIINKKDEWIGLVEILSVSEEQSLFEVIVAPEWDIGDLLSTKKRNTSD